MSFSQNEVDIALDLYFIYQHNRFTSQGANSKNLAFEAFMKLNPDEVCAYYSQRDTKINRLRQMSDNDISFETHPEYERIHERYKNVSLQSLGTQISEMLSSARHGIAQHVREFDGQGGRRYEPAMATQGGREDAQEARLLKLYLELRVEKAEMIRVLCLFAEEELTGDALEIDTMLEPTKEMLRWNPIECTDGQSGKVSWRILRHSWNGETKTREYGKTDEKGVLEFVNREQAQSVCDSWNGPADYTPCAPGSNYVYEDESKIRVRAREKKVKAVLRPRVGPGALAAILAEDD